MLPTWQGDGWWRATLFLCLAVAVKPLALVLVLLYFLLVAPMRGRLALGMAAVLLAPFAHPDWRYVMAQERAMVAHLLWASQPVVWRFDEIGNMLRRFGLDLAPMALSAIRWAAALLTLLLAWLARRHEARPRGAVLILALAVTYLMIFNPRTELGGYLNLAAIAGAYMAESWQARGDAVPGLRAGATATAAVLALLILALGTQAYGSWVFRATDVWLKPLLALGFYGFLAWRVMRAARPRGEAAA